MSGGNSENDLRPRGPGARNLDLSVGKDFPRALGIVKKYSTD